MSKERFEIIDDVICDDGEKLNNEMICSVLNRLEKSRNHHKNAHRDALRENELLWQVVDGFKAFLELSFEGKI